jgi:glyoxylase-like metal-dependent hydrolase (beta-lactamase superfamily II)
MTFETALEHLYGIEIPTPFPVGPITLYLACTPGEPLTLVDTGPRTPETHNALAAEFSRLGYGLADLDRIIVTHAHVDHFGLVADLVDRSGAMVMTHPWSLKAVSEFETDRAHRLAFYASLMRQAAVPPKAMEVVGHITEAMNSFARSAPVDSTLSEGDTVRLASRDWQVLHTPGHANGLICLYEPASKILLSSDHLLAEISSNPVVEPPPPGHSNRLGSLILYRDSLQRVAAMDIELALPSHGPLIHDVPALVSERLAFHRRRLARVVASLAAGARTTWDVTGALFPDRSPLDTFLAVSEVIGHLDVLQMEGKVKGTMVEGEMLWEVVS